jgi:hypothetical protein
MHMWFGKIARFDNKRKRLLFNHTPAHQTYMQKARPYNNHQSEPGAGGLGGGGLVEAEEERAPSNVHTEGVCAHPGVKDFLDTGGKRHLKRLFIFV